MRIRNIILVSILAFLPVSGWTSQTTNLQYDAFVGSQKVARAEFLIERAGEDFKIEGEARAVGMIKLFTKWRSLFSAVGRFMLGKPVDDNYRVVQKKRKKEKHIELRDGVVFYRRNGEDRDPRPKLDGMYLLSALFLSSDCASPGQTIHDGKDYFELQLLNEQFYDQPTPEGVVLQCEFDVVDEDNEHANAVVTLIDYNGLKVPLEMHLTGAINGRLQLKL